MNGSEDEIKKTPQQALKHHPDGPGGASAEVEEEEEEERTFEEVSKAFALLPDPGK